MMKHIKEIKAVALHALGHKDELKKRVGELEKLFRYVEEDKGAYAVGFGDYADVRWNVEMINAHQVWDAYFTTVRDAAFGYEVTVAVLDTGIDYKHPELYGKAVNLKC